MINERLLSTVRRSKPYIAANVLCQWAGRTVVLVSHRASTMDIAERTYSVERGRLS